MNSTQPENRTWPIWLPLIIALLITVLIRVFDLDRQISALFYDPVKQTWPYEQAEPLRSFYYFGRFPPALLALFASLVAIFPNWMNRWNPYPTRDEFRRSGMFLSLLFLIAPGLIIEAGFKSYWGRPRPIQ
jgi:hypothetical protein